MLNKSSKIVVIGAGKVAHSIIPLLVKNNYSVEGVVSRSIRPVRTLTNKYKLKFSSDDINSIPAGVKVFFIMVPDNQIAAAASQLSKLRNDFRGCLCVHTSGSENSAALKALEDKGAMTASFHIMQTFPSLKQTNIKNSFASIETKSEQAEKYLFSLSRTFGLKSFKLSAEAKVYYHLAGVFAANFLNSNIFASEKLFENTGVTVEDHFAIFETIISTTLSNIKKNDSAASLSGPVQRGDSITIKKHIEALAKLKPAGRKKLLQSYAAQSMMLLDIIKEGEGKLSSGQMEIERILNAALKKF